MHCDKTMRAAFAASLFVFCAAFAGAQDKPVAAPLNPDYVKYMEAQRAGLLPKPSAHGYSLGYMPPPVDARLFAGHGAKSALNAGSPPSSYDLRTANGVNKITSVKNQGSCEDCWAFAAMASMESYFMPGEDNDFSEDDLSANNGIVSYCAPGSDFISTAYFTRWSGPLNNGTTTPVVKHAQNIIFLSSRTDASDNNRIKNAVMTYGGVAVSLYASVDMQDSSKGSYYNPATYSYYYNGSSSANHEVTVIGWDDNYAASNFSTTPGGNGAFLCKNSWGTGFGDAGYFWVSYYDVIIGAGYSTAFTGESVLNYTRLYSYDPLGWGGGYTHSWSANVFTAAVTEKLTAVGFYTTVEGATYNIQIYTGVTSVPTDGTLVSAANVSGTLSEAGYHTVSLASPVQLTQGAKFSVVINFSNDGSYPAAVSYSGSATASGQGFISKDGATWTDVYTLGNSPAVCIKAYSGVSYTVSGTVADASGTPVSGVSIAISGSSSASTATNSSGVYSIALPELGSYTFTPSKSNYSFSPPSASTDTLTGATTKNFTATALVVGINSVRAYPTPARMSQRDKIYFHNISLTSPSVDIYIYSVSGKQVRHLSEAAGDIIITNGASEKTAFWDGKNGSGGKVASGVYVYEVKAGDSVKTGKIGIIW